MSSIWVIPGTYTAREIVYAVKHAKAHPDDRYMLRDCGTVMTAERYRQWFRARLHEKINDLGMGFRVPLRKLTGDYQLGLRRDANRLRGYGGLGRILETPEVRKKLGADHVHIYVNGTHRLCSDAECESRLSRGRVRP
jgi:hypothetical protein